MQAQHNLRVANVESVTVESDFCSSAMDGFELGGRCLSIQTTASCIHLIFCNALLVNEVSDSSFDVYRICRGSTDRGKSTDVLRLSRRNLLDSIVTTIRKCRSIRLLNCCNLQQATVNFY